MNSVHARSSIRQHKVDVRDSNRSIAVEFNRFEKLRSERNTIHWHRAQRVYIRREPRVTVRRSKVGREICQRLRPEFLLQLGELHADSVSVSRSHESTDDVPIRARISVSDSPG